MVAQYNKHIIKAGMACHLAKQTRQDKPGLPDIVQIGLLDFCVLRPRLISGTSSIFSRVISGRIYRTLTIVSRLTSFDLPLAFFSCLTSRRPHPKSLAVSKQMAV